MGKVERTLEWATDRVTKVIQNPLAKLILIVLHNAGATKSSARMSLTELARRVGANKWQVLRTIKGAKKHHAVLRGFVHYPDKGRRKGFYLLKAGRLLAKYLAEEKRLTKSVIKRIAQILLERSSTSHHEVTTKSPSSHQQVTTKSPLSHRFPVHPSTPISLSPCFNTLSPANAEKLSSDLKPVGNDYQQGSLNATERNTCERCGKQTGQLSKFSFTIRAEIVDLCPEAVRYRLRYLCDACHRELTRQVVEAWKRLQEETEKSGRL
jgi:hypothetical protein